MKLRSLFLLITALFWNAVGYYAVRCDEQCPSPAVSSRPDEAVFSMSEVAMHGTVEDCWIAIDHKVYSVGPFIDIHPGDSGLMRTYCGKDASGPYAVKDSGKEKGKPHSPRANEFLEEYYVGRLANS